MGASGAYSKYNNNNNNNNNMETKNPCPLLTSDRVLDERQLLIDILNCDIDALRNRLQQDADQQIFLARFRSYGFFSDCCAFGITSIELCYALYDMTLNYNKDKSYNNAYLQMIDLHKEICTYPIERIDYSQIPFIPFNAFGECPEDANPFFDEEETEELIKSGVPAIDIELTNCGTQHIEKRVIELLKQGATPYFLSLFNSCADEKDEEQIGYDDIAPLLGVFNSEDSFAWTCFLGGLPLVIADDTSDHQLLSIIEGGCISGASVRMLYLVDKYLDPQKRDEGEMLMKEKLGEVFDIL